MSIIPGKPESPAHWRYFLALENDLMQLARYIEFSKGNFSTFSMELASLLLRSGSEVDVVAKLLCKKINPRTKAKNIGHYANQIGAALPKIGTFKVELPMYGLELQPWKNWSNHPRTSPLWWKAHNNVKHRRNSAFAEANLKNTLNAVGGLYVLVLHLYRFLGQNARLSPNPLLLRPTEDFFNDYAIFESEFLIVYDL